MPFLKDEVISHFTSNHDIIECIIASALIPFALNGRPWYRYRDWRICMDAGITNIPGVLRNYEGFPSIIPHRPADEQSLYVQQESTQSQSQPPMRSRLVEEQDKSDSSSAHVEADDDHASDSVSVSDSDDDDDDDEDDDDDDNDYDGDDIDDDGDEIEGGTGSSSSSRAWDSTGPVLPAKGVPLHFPPHASSNNNHSSSYDRPVQREGRDRTSKKGAGVVANNNTTTSTTTTTKNHNHTSNNHSNNHNNNHNNNNNNNHNHNNSNSNSNMTTTWLTLWDLMATGAPPGLATGHGNGHGRVDDQGPCHSSSDYGEEEDEFDGDYGVATSKQPPPHNHRRRAMESADDDDDDNVDGSSSFSIAPPHRDNALVSLVRSYLSLVTTVAKHCIGGVVGKGLAPGQGLGAQALGGQGIEVSAVAAERDSDHPLSGTQPQPQPQPQPLPLPQPQPLQQSPQQSPPQILGPVQNLGTASSPGAGPSPGLGAGAAWSGSSLLERLAAFNLQAYHQRQLQQIQQLRDATEQSSSSSSLSSNHQFNMAPAPYDTPLGGRGEDGDGSGAMAAYPYDEWRGVRQHGQGLGPGLGQELVRRGGYYRYGNGQEDTIMSSSSSVDNSEHSSILLPSASRPYGLAYLGAILYPNPTLTLT